ncbi:MAG: trehalose-binding protein [Syntrophobacteraceae bacterium CG2_30_61_12]|nr:MAG: trehalose-binding protein [Syntrophobacteraceae bacterium CG2_30_61_12]
MKIGPYSYQEFLQTVETFHGYTAPGVVIGGFMVEFAKQGIGEGILYDAMCETPKCLPDAVQLLTPCTTGNGWLKVVNLGRFALSLYDKYRGNGVRVSIDSKELDQWSEIKSWLFKLKPKAEQDKQLLLDQIEQAGTSLYRRQSIQVPVRSPEEKSGRYIAACRLCGEAYPANDGAICRGCQGQSPYETPLSQEDTAFLPCPPLQAVPLQQAVGKMALHDMTQIIPTVLKGPAITHGQRIAAGDLCRLQRMGRHGIYVGEKEPPASDWVHEDDAARAFAEAMAGEGITFKTPAREGKINLLAERDGLLMVEAPRLEQFNLAPGVMCASRQGYSLVESGKTVAGTRAIPLFLPRAQFEQAIAILTGGPLFRVLPLRRAKVGILVTGTEVFQGLIQDKFVPIITAKIETLGCQLVQSRIVPDDRVAIGDGIRLLLAAGAELIITTAGLSVDPDDVTRPGLLDAGATDVLYGAPILPGAMTLLARIGNVPLIGVPACALFFKTTSLDLLLPRLLAGVPVTRGDLARLGHGALCLECRSCTFPKCPFGK